MCGSDGAAKSRRAERTCASMLQPASVPETARLRERISVEARGVINRGSAPGRDAEHVAPHAIGVTAPGVKNLPLRSRGRIDCHGARREAQGGESRFFLGTTQRLPRAPALPCRFVGVFAAEGVGARVVATMAYSRCLDGRCDARPLAEFA